MKKGTKQCKICNRFTREPITFIVWHNDYVLCACCWAHLASVIMRDFRIGTKHKILNSEQCLT